MKIGIHYLIVINVLFPFLIGCGEGAKGQQKATKAAAMDTYLSQEHRFALDSRIFPFSTTNLPPVVWAKLRRCAIFMSIKGRFNGK